MKTRLLSLTLFLFSLNSFAQYTPITRDSAEWRVSYSYKINGVIPTTVLGALYHNEEDTVISSFNYTRFRHNQNGPIFHPDFFIREDSTSKKVFIRYLVPSWNPVQVSKEYLFHDFSLNVGDTMFTDSSAFSNIPIYWVVTNRDSILVNGSKRAYLDVKLNDTLNFSGSNERTDRWVEGIGSETYFHFPLDIQMNTFETGATLVCYKNIKKGYRHYSSLFGGNCDASIGLRNDVPMSKLEVFPNPFQHELKIYIGQNFSGNISIVNLAGIKVFEQEESNISEVDLSIESIPLGIYVLHLNGENLTESILIEKR